MVISICIELSLRFFKPLGDLVCIVYCQFIMGVRLHLLLRSVISDGRKTTLPRNSRSNSDLN